MDGVCNRTLLCPAPWGHWEGGKRSDCRSVRPPVRPSVRQSVRNAISSYTIGRNATKFFVRVAHMNGLCNSTIFLPRPLGHWGGAKRSNIIKIQLQSQFLRFLNHTLCVFSQMKNSEHIGRDFHSVAWVMPQGTGVWGHKLNVPKFNQI